MRKIANVTFILLLAAASVCTADEAVTVTLRPAVEVGEGVIRLADVAELPENCPAAMGQVPLGNAPWPGNRRPVSRALVQMRMLASDFASAHYCLAGAEVCIVQRRSLLVSSRELADAARDRLAELAAVADGEVELELVRAPRDIYLAEGEQKPELRAEPAGDGAPVGRVRVNVDVVRGDERLERASAIFEVKLWRKVAAARRRIARGERLSDENITFIRREVGRAGSSLITAASALEGRVASRPVPAGGLLDRACVAAPERPVLVRRNQRVRLVARIGNLRAVALGKADGTGRPGEVVKAVNLATGREVAGVVQADGSVQVLMGDER